jgi:hypothetical protein
MNNGLLKYSMSKDLRISLYIRKPFLIYDFATAPFWISLYMRKIRFSFLSVHHTFRAKRAQSPFLWWSNHASLYFMFLYYFLGFLRPLKEMSLGQCVLACNVPSLDDLSSKSCRNRDLHSRDQKTKCRLYWWLIEFIDWRYRQSCWNFRPLL